MTLIQLHYLVAIVDASLNITLASERVHATQPGLSKQLRKLEDELGFRLFVRKGKRLESVTYAGQQVMHRARRILDEASNIRSIAANLRHEDRGELHIATTHTQARFVLQDAISTLNTHYPLVSVHLQPGGDSDVLSQLESGWADLAVISSAGAPPPGGIALPVYRWNRVILAPFGHALTSHRNTLTLADLAGQPLLSYESSLKPESSLRRAFEAEGLFPRITMTASDADLIKIYVRAGLGIGILAEMAILPGDTDLLSLPADHLLPQCTTWIVLRRETVLREYVLDFIHTLAPHLDRRDITRALAGSAPQCWPEAPHWRDRALLR